MSSDTFIPKVWKDGLSIGQLKHVIFSMGMHCDYVIYKLTDQTQAIQIFDYHNLHYTL